MEMASYLQYGYQMYDLLNLGSFYNLSDVCNHI